MFFINSLSAVAGCLFVLECVTEMRLSPQAPAAQRRDFPFAEIRIIAILSLIEHQRTALSACVCDCEDGLFVHDCFPAYVRTKKESEVLKSEHINASVYVRRTLW